MHDIGFLMQSFQLFAIFLFFNQTQPRKAYEKKKKMKINWKNKTKKTNRGYFSSFANEDWLEIESKLWQQIQYQTSA